MKIGDVVRIKIDQDYTCQSACGKLGIIEAFDEPNIRVRIQRDFFGEHYTQLVRKRHLDEYNES